MKAVTYMKHLLKNVSQLILAFTIGIALTLGLIVSLSNAQMMESVETAVTVDLAVTANAPAHVAPGTTFVVNVAYSTLDDAPAPDMRVTATLPAMVEFISATDRWGNLLPPSAIDGNIISWDIEPSAIPTCCQHILITERVNQAAGEGEVLTTSVEINTSAIELNLGNNVDSAVSVVCAMAGSFKTVSANEAMPGDVLTYTIVLSLAQQQGMTNQERMIHLTDTLPSAQQMRFLGWTSAVTGTHAGQMLQWQGRVRAGEPITFQYRLGIHGDVTPGLHITNGAHLAWSGGQIHINPVTTVITMHQYAHAFGANGGEWHYGDGVSVTVPPGALTDTARFEFKYLYSGTHVISGPPGLMFAHRAFDLTAFRYGEQLHQFARPITLTMTYSDTDVMGLNRQTLRLWYRNGAGEPWAMLGEPVRHMSGTLSFSTTHFTEFALFGRGAYTTWLPLTTR